MAYLIDPQRVHDAARRAVGLPHAAMVRAVIDELCAVYPGHIETSPNWILNVTGGATGMMTLLHCSWSEYIMIFGTPIGTEGFSGRYRMEIHDFVLSGEMWTYTEDRCGERVVSRPGEGAVLPRRTGKGFRLAEDSWLLEYGRGPVVTMLPTGLSQAVVNLDGGTIWKTVTVSSRLMFKALRQGKR